MLDPSISHLRSTVTVLPIVVVSDTNDGPAVIVTGVGNPHLLESVPSGHLTINVLVLSFYLY